MELALKKTRWKKQTHRLGIEQDVVFVGSEQPYGYYSLFDFFMLPSDDESTTLPLLEALSFGLPCVVLHHRGKHSIISSGYNGILVGKNNSRAFAQALGMLIEKESLRKRLSENAKKSVAEHFNINQMFDSYRSLFSDLVEKTGRR